MISEKRIKKMTRENLSVDQFIKIARRLSPDIKVFRNKIYSLGNGAFLGVRKSKRGKWYRMHLKTIWIMPYTCLYGTTKTKNGKVRIGRELLISNRPLPKGETV